MSGASGESSGPLATLGKAMGAVVAIEQQLSTALNVVANVLPSFPAVRITDMDIGVPHAHGHPPNLIPPAPPVPLPSTGPVIPIPIMSGAKQTLINGMPAARCGDMGLGIWCGGYVPMYEIFLGSSNVWIEGGRAARVGVDITKHCVFSSPKPADVPLGPPIGATITSSANVLIGGVPMPSLMALAIAGAFKALGKLAKTAGRAIKSSSRFQRGWCALKRAVFGAEPVNMVTGEVVLEQQDFALPWRIPITWTRRYRSQSTYPGLCGYGWETPADARLVFFADGTVEFHDGSADVAVFVPSTNHGPRCEPIRGMVLSTTQNGWTVRTKSRVIYHFLKPACTQTEALVQSLTDLCGNTVRFIRSDGELREIRDDTGRRVEVKSRRGRIEQMVHFHPDHPAPWLLIRYEYNSAGDLVTAYDPLNAPYRYSYEDHVLIQHKNRNGLSFYYEYDRLTPNGRCVHTWGDDGLYNYHFEYRNAVDEHLEFGGETLITDSLGNTKVLRYDENHFVQREVDALGGERRYEYDEAGRTSAATDALGARTEYYYDAAGNLLRLVRPDGVVIVMKYNERHHLIELTDANGNRWHQEWSDDGLLKRQVSPLGNTTTYEYDDRGVLREIVRPNGGCIRFRNDAFGNPVEVIDAAGYQTKLSWDALGNLVARTDPLGHTSHFRYDSASRLIESVSEAGRREKYAYDGQGNLTDYCDGESFVTKLEYFGLGEIRRRRQPDGQVVEYEYDTEERLIAVKNQRGERYTLRRDGLGRVVEEIDYWGQSRSYKYNAVGRLTGFRDALGREIEYKTDLLGRLIAKILPDGSIESFKYDPEGNLTSAVNPQAEATRVFDADGQMLKETINEFTVESTYGADGSRVRRDTSFGNSVRLHHDGRGLPVSVTINDRVPMRLEHDALGRPVKETLGPHIHRRLEYDADGLLSRQQLLAHGFSVYDSSYQYDDRRELVRRSDSRWGVEQLSYDAMGRIRQYVDSTGIVREYLHDPAGDLLRHTLDGAGRDAITASWTRTSTYNGIICTFDAVGNMVERRDVRGVLRLEWDANNRLSGSHNPDGTTTIYGYDALGRRVFKETTGSDGTAKRTTFGWDDQTLCSERCGERQDEFVYGTDAFEPLAMLTASGGVYHYHCELNGAPMGLIDEGAQLHWVACYNPLGGTEHLQEASFAQALRLEGQYFDRETGLAYNRHRYFESMVGHYVSRDPLGLMAGENLYRLGPNTLRWIDPLGLTCKTVALGKDIPGAGMKELAKQKGGSWWKNWAKDGITRRTVDRRFGRAFHDAVDRADQIHFSLDGIDNVAEAVQAGKAGFKPATIMTPGNMTNAELHYIANNPDLLEKTTFFRTDPSGVVQKVDSPF